MPKLMLLYILFRALLYIQFKAFLGFHSEESKITRYIQVLLLSQRINKGSLRHQEQADLKSSQNIVAQNNYASRTSCSGKGP